MSWKKSKPIYFKGTTQKADSEKGIIKDVVIIQEFVNEDRDAYGDNFDEVFLDQLISAGNAQTMGVKSRFGHPNMCETTLGSYLGRFKDFRKGVNTDGKKVVLADLYLDPIAKQAPGKGDIYTYVLDMSKKNSDMFGNSIVYEPDQPEERIEKDSNGNDVKNYYQRLKEENFLASDMVDSPAATDNLFKDNNELDLGIEITSFLDDHPRILEVIQKDESIIEKFLLKYFTYNKSKTQMRKEKATKTAAQLKKESANKLKEEISNLLDQHSSKSFDASTVDGKTVTISDENSDGAPEEGDMVTDTETGEPVVSMTIELNDGTKVTTDETGKITTVVNSSEDEPADDVSKDVSKLTATLKQKETRIKELESLLEENEKQLEEIQTSFTKLKENLAKTQGTFKPKETDTSFKKETETERDFKKEKEERRSKYSSSKDKNKK